MDTSKITTSLLKSFAKLEKKRAELLSNLAKVELAIKKATPKAVAAPAKPVKAVAAPAKPAARRGRPAKVVAPAPAAKVAKIAKAPAAKKAAAPVSTGRRGALKDSIIAVLQSVGENGISVKDLSDKLGVKNQNVHVWFSTTGRKLGNIAKVGSGKYGWKA